MGKVVIKRSGVDHLYLIQRGKVTVNSASLSQGMLTDDTVKFSVSSNSKLDIKINDTLEVFGNTYRINTLPTFKKISNSSYTYEIEAQGLMYDLLRCKFFNADAMGFKTTTNFPLIGNLEVFLIAIKNNMSRFSVLWEIGTFAETETKMMTFGDDTCLSALQKICQEFKTDFWVKSEGGKHKIHTGQFGSTLPIEFEYGKGKGLYSLSRSNVDNNGIVNRLYVNGGSQNIPAGYRSFSDNLKFSDAGYLEDTALIAEIGLKEGTLDLPEIYPKRTGKITALGGTKFKFKDSTMDFDLNEKNPDGSTKFLIAGTTAKVHFNTGNLAGYEFEIKKGGYNHATKEFEIIPFKNETGQKFPNETALAFQFSINDEYVLLDIVMPPTYITNAETELLAKGAEQFALNKTAKVTYDLEVDPEYLKTLATPISIGDYVRVKDTDLGIDKVIRVQQITRNFITANKPTPYNYKITLADSYEINYASQMILDIKDIKNVVSITNLGNINLSQLGYKTTEELRNLVFDTDGYFDAGNIKPFSIQTNMLTVGAQSQQLSCSVVFSVNDGGIVNKVDSKAGVLFSQTFNKSWNIAALNTTIPDNNFRYVYSKCSKVGSSGTIFYTQSQIKFDEDPNDYYFLLGILHTVTEGVRVLSITIGTTTINGGLIRTGVISSLDGLTTFNLDTGEFKGKFTFSNGTNVQTAVENAQNTANATASVTNFLQTTVDGNVVSTGTLQVGNATGANAGITGVVDRGGKSVRIWAGATYAGKNTANWLMRDDGVEEQWFNGILVRQRGVINGAYVETWFNLNGQIGKKITFSTDGKILEEWYNEGVLVYQIGQNGIYYVAEIPESFNYKGLVNCNTNLIQSNLEFLEAPIRQMMYQKTNDPRRFELHANKNSYLYNAGQNVYSEGNKQYDGFKNSKSKTDTVANGWYAYEILGFMLEDGVDSTRRFANVFRTEDGKIVQNGIVAVETNGYTFNQF